MNRNFLLLLFLNFSVLSFGQDTLNLTDVRGLKQGLWKKTDTSGRKIYIGQFKDGIPYGYFYYYYPDGKMKTESRISAGGKKARTVSYYTNGKKMAAGNYLNEKKDSTWQFFNETDGSLVAEEWYRLGIKDGPSKTYYPDGRIAESLTWKNGLKTGPWEQYYSDGKIKFRGSFLNNEKTSTFSAFGLSGQVMFTGQYSKGHQEGQWLYYDEKGKIIKKEFYKAGILEKTLEF